MQKYWLTKNEKIIAFLKTQIFEMVTNKRIEYINKKITDILVRYNYLSVKYFYDENRLVIRYKLTCKSKMTEIILEPTYYAF